MKNAKKPMGSPKKQSRTRPIKAASLDVTKATSEIVSNEVETPVICTTPLPLSSLGYQPITIFAFNNQKYIKSLNQLGEKVYIKVDQPCSDVPDIILESSSSVLPHSLKIGCLKLANYNTIGVTFEWPESGHLCCLEYQIKEDDENMNIVESNYKMTDSAEAVFNGYPVSYPLIKFSEILADNDLVLQGCNKVISQLRNTTFKNNNDDLQILLDAIQQFQDTVADFIDLSNEQAHILNTNLKKKTAIAGAHDYITNLLNVQKQVCELRVSVDSMTTLVDTWITKAEEEFERIK